MLKRMCLVTFVVLTVGLLGVCLHSVVAEDIPSGIVAVYPNKEPVKEDDFGPEGHGSVDNDNSNLTLDFGFHVPTPTPTVTPTPTPLPTSTPLPTPTPKSPLSANRGQRFAKRREEVGLRKPCLVVPAELEKPWFITDIAMYAASEMHHTSRPFIQWSEEHGVAVEQSSLTPTGIREFGAEILEFSVSNIHSVMSNAGIGVHLKQSPLIVEAAASADMPPDAYLETLFAHFAERANLRTLPDNVYPLFLEYAEGDPGYTMARNVNDWRTLQWNPQSFDTHLIPSALGQTLLRQALLIEEFLAGNHREDGTSAADGAFAGVSDVKGFLGLLAAEEVVNKLWFMRHHLLHQRDDDGLPYFPYQSVAEADSESGALGVSVVDDRSRLFDQLSLLWGLSEMMLLTDADAPQSYRRAFDDDMLFPGRDSGRMSAAGIHALAAELAAIVFETLARLHALPQIAGLVETFPAACDAEEPQTCESVMSTTHLALSLPALARYYQAMPKDPAMRERILALMRQAADAVAQRIADAGDNGVPDIVTIRVSGDEIETLTDDDSRTLTAQMAAIRGLLAAHQVLGDPEYRALAFDLYERIDDMFWDDALGIYADRQTRSAYRYTPLTLGAAVGALRELAYAAESSMQAVRITHRMRTFTRRIARFAAMQLSELEQGAGEEFLIPVGGMSVIRPPRQVNNIFGFAPVLTAEVRLRREAILALYAERPTDSCEQARTSLRSTYYYTDIGMYAASELARSQDALSVTLAQQGLMTAKEAKSRNPELFEPVAGDTTGAKARDFSDYNLVHVATKSSLGVGLQYGPVVRQAAEAAQVDPETYLNDLLQRYAAATGLEQVPDNLYPIFLEFEGGVPELREQERWHTPNMDRSIVPSALGQSLVRQVLWLGDVLTVRHNDQNRLQADGPYPGRNAEEGFLGLLVAQEVANKLVALAELLPVDIPEDSGLTTPSGTYIPHRFEIDFDGEEPQDITVADADSYLFDAASLAWGVSEFVGLLRNPRIDMFGPGQLVAGEYDALANRVLRRVFENLVALHWDAARGTFVDLRVMSDEPTGDVGMSAHNAAFAVMALDSVARHAGDPALRDRAKALLLKQAEFLAYVLWRADDGAVANGAAFDGKSRNADLLDGLKTLLAHTAAIRSFVIAYSVSGDGMYLERANRTFRYMERIFWDENLQVYRSAIGGSQHQYTPLNAGMTVGALQALLTVGDPDTAPSLHEHLAKFFERIIERTGLQLSEQRHFLDVSGEVTQLAPVMAADLLIQPAGSSVDIAVPQAGSTLIYVVEFTEVALRCDESAAYVEDILPEGLTFVRSVPAPVAYDGQILRWSVADLVPDDEGIYRITLEVRVDPLGLSYLAALGGVAADWLTGERDWQINNCAQLSCRISEDAAQSTFSDCVGTTIQRPLIGIEKTLRSVIAEPGREAQFEIAVTNLSDVTAYRLTVTDVLPDGFLYVEDSVRSPDTVLIGLDDIEPLVWVLEDLGPRQSIRLTYTVFIDSNVVDDVYSTTVQVHAMDRAGYPFESNEFVYTFAVERAMLIDVRQRLAGADEGVQMLSAENTYTVVTELDNLGSDSLQEGVLRVLLPPGLAYAAGSSRLNNTPLADPESESGALRWRFGELPVKGQVVLQYTLRQQRAAMAAPEVLTEIGGLATTGQAYRSRLYRFDLQSSE